MTDTPTAVAGKRLRRARQRQGLTQADLAQRANCSRTTITRLERGKVTPSMSVATALATVLGLSVEALFGPLADPASSALFKQVVSDDLALALLDCEGDDEAILTWMLPSASLAAEEGMSASQFASQRAKALIALGSAIEGLRARGWAISVETRSDLTRNMTNAEMIVTVQADFIPQHERGE